ncbi:hypothetical protein BGZ57DRAFT_959387 [Hyaloscypha finlandica]|nr:hypothetical protein BGZ57DRAFT_959387 [Hyaloscypha finlandica]
MARFSHPANIKKFFLPNESSSWLTQRRKLFALTKPLRRGRFRQVLFEQLAQVLIIKDNIINTLLETPVQVLLPLPLLRHPSKTPIPHLHFRNFHPTTKIAHSTWNSEDGRTWFRKLAKALLERIIPNQIMKADNSVRKPREQLASPSQSWLVLWVQYESYDNWSTEIKFDRHLREDLLKPAWKGDRRYLMHKEGPKVVTLMFEFFRSLDVRAGRQSLREGEEPA